MVGYNHPSRERMGGKATDRCGGLASFAAPSVDDLPNGAHRRAGMCSRLDNGTLQFLEGAAPSQRPDFV